MDWNWNSQSHSEGVKNDQINVAHGTARYGTSQLDLTITFKLIIKVNERKRLGNKSSWFCVGVSIYTARHKYTIWLTHKLMWPRYPVILTVCLSQPIHCLFGFGNYFSKTEFQSKTTSAFTVFRETQFPLGSSVLCYLTKDCCDVKVWHWITDMPTKHETCDLGPIFWANSQYCQMCMWISRNQSHLLSVHRGKTHMILLRLGAKHIVE